MKYILINNKKTGEVEYDIQFTPTPSYIIASNMHLSSAERIDKKERRRKSQRAARKEKRRNWS